MGVVAGEIAPGNGPPLTSLHETKRPVPVLKAP
jgi:hypothetical protein